ncbi:MAG: endonuclease Q family protein [Patescibacteria group bacterium]
MRYIADLHIHSKYSRACSKDLDIPHINQWAKIKGIDIVGSGDFTHPAWLKHLKENLVPALPGLFKLTSPSPLLKKDGDDSVLFMLTTELSCIYSQGGKVRRIHLCIFAPDFATIDQIIVELEKRKVNLKSDGRPIMGLSAIELTKIILGVNPRCLVIPAHAWTPWFSVFGSNSGFNTLEECFGEMTKHIYAIETGLSSDPAMNWRLSALDKITLISNSDAHSLPNLGREANVFEISENEISYDEIYQIIKNKDQKSFLYTIEFFPEEGKYHFDGHRDCDVCLSPVQSKKLKEICPVCKKDLTVGVLSRVEELADRPIDFKPDTIGYKSLVPLAEIIADVLEVGKSSKKVNQHYLDLISKGGSEFKILLDLTKEELNKITLPEIALAIINVRQGKVVVKPGFDGKYGVVEIIDKKQNFKPKQKSLF